MDFTGDSLLKNSPAKAGDTVSISGLGRSFREGNGNSLQCPCMRNPWTEDPDRLQSKGLQKNQT